MNTNHTSLIRGLNIAVIVLAALSLIGCAFTFTTIESSKGLIYDYVLSEYGYGQDYYDYDYLDDDFYYDFDDDDFDWDGYWDDGYGHKGPHHSSAALAHPVSLSSSYSYDEALTASVDLILGIVNAVLIWEIIVSLATLLFGIFGVVHAGKRDKLKMLMVLGIVGAIVSFLGGHIILMVLFIISAVMANKDKNMPLSAPEIPVQPYGGPEIQGVPNYAAQPTPTAPAPVPAPGAEIAPSVMPTAASEVAAAASPEPQPAVASEPKPAEEIGSALAEKPQDQTPGSTPSAS